MTLRYEGREVLWRDLRQRADYFANPTVEKDGPQAALAGSLRAARSGRLSPLR